MWLIISFLFPHNLLFCYVSLLLLLLLISLRVLLHQRMMMVFHWSLSDSKSADVFGTLFNILANLYNAVVWMVSARPPISNPSSLFTKSLWMVPSALTTIGITVTFMFHNFLTFSARSKYLSFFSFSLIFTLQFAGTVKERKILEPYQRT